MPQSYYIFRSGRLRRRENTLYLEQEREDSHATRQPIPIENVRDLYLFAEIDLNTKLLSFLGQHGIPVHCFNHYGFYVGSFYPRESNVSGDLLVRQVEHYLDVAKRLAIAREFVAGALFHIRKNLSNYRDRGDSVSDALSKVEECTGRVASCQGIPELMSEEGRAREAYYQAWNAMLNIEEPFEKRVRRPPNDLVNVLLSFGNSLLYAATLSEIYVTQLAPTVSYLHEPGKRRFSLALDLSEVFKPLIVDRLIFRLLNCGEIQGKDLEALGEAEGVLLKEEAKKKFVQRFEEVMQTTVYHRRLKHSVSYRQLIRLEAYKLVRHLIGMETYQALRAWW